MVKSCSSNHIAKLLWFWNFSASFMIRLMISWKLRIVQFTVIQTQTCIDNALCNNFFSFWVLKQTLEIVVTNRLICWSYTLNTSWTLAAFFTILNHWLFNTIVISDLLRQDRASEILSVHHLWHSSTFSVGVSFACCVSWIIPYCWCLLSLLALN